MTRRTGWCEDREFRHNASVLHVPSPLSPSQLSPQNVNISSDIDKESKREHQFAL